MNRYAEYLERDLPHVWPDGSVCQCGECAEAREMGLGRPDPTGGRRARAGEWEAQNWPEHSMAQVVSDLCDIHKEEDPFALNHRLLGDEDDDWTDVPFWFAWLVWSTVVSIPVVIPTVLAQHFFHLSDPHALILQAGLAGVIGWLVTLITRWRHQSKINPYWWCSEDVERSRHEGPTVNRGGGLHRFSLTVGFKHEHLEDR